MEREEGKALHLIGFKPANLKLWGKCSTTVLKVHIELFDQGFEPSTIRLISIHRANKSGAFFSFCYSDKSGVAALKQETVLLWAG